MFAADLTPTPEQRDIVHARARALKDALAAWHAGHDYYNLAEAPAEARAVLAPNAYRRLREIKAQYDPQQAIISAHPVRLPDQQQHKRNATPTP
jgi:FAD/FMN-containing dehydrogenase